LKRRVASAREDPARLPERFGQASAARPAGPLLWLHAASVGESLAILPLVAALLATRPALQVLVTTGTVTSARLLDERLPARARHQYALVDRPAAWRAFLTHWRPQMALLVESELWPNLILESRRHAEEEEAILQAHGHLAAQLPGLLTIIAPRHPERGQALPRAGQDARPRRRPALETATAGPRLRALSG
jgi:3-deoxy-D-manno-octulosonic-acid transferase